MPHMVRAKPLPETTDTVVVAIDHGGLRFHLTRSLLSHGVYTALLSDAERAVRRLGDGLGPRQAAAIVVERPSAFVARQLLRRIAGLGWTETTVFLVGCPSEVRPEARRRGAVVVEANVGAEELTRAILERTAAA